MDEHQGHIINMLRGEGPAIVTMTLSHSTKEDKRGLHVHGYYVSPAATEG